MHVTSELKPCPFCARTPRAERDDHGASGGYAHWILCPGCGATSDYYRYASEAAASWNRRAADECR
jgi:Lar family restriction alleviation protein